MNGDPVTPLPEDEQLATDKQLAAELRAALDAAQSLRDELHERGWTVYIRVGDAVKVEIEKRIEL